MGAIEIAMSALDISQLKFLIVEDNPFMRAILNQLLRNYHVRTTKEANDGASAFMEMRTFKPDIILLDWEMRPLDGLDFVKLVRTGDDSPDRFVPIIMVTGHSEAHRITDARDSGVNEFLVKPLSANSLFSRITELIEKPRSFVETKSYFGPDRRRRSVSYDGTERRGGAAPTGMDIEVADADQGMSQTQLDSMFD